MLLENNAYPRDVRVRAEAESLASGGHHVTVVAPRARGQRRRERIRGVDVVRFRGIDGSGHGAAGFVAEYAVAGLALHWAAIRELVRGATVLHLHNPPDIFFGAGLLFRLAGRRVIFDHHDLFPETIEVKFGGGIAARVARWCQRLTFAAAHRVLATNESYAEVARSAGKRAEDVIVVRNAPPAAWIELPGRRRAGVLERLHVAYLGAISVQDGVQGLAPILARVCDGAGPVDVHLTVIGDGDARREFERALADHGLSERVTFSGWVASEDVPHLLMEADVCVDPAPATDVNERSTMIKIAEYMALGKPVVAYDLLETQRTAQDAALLVRRGDVDGFAGALVTLARDPALRAELEAKARQRASELTWEHSETALLAAYRGLRR
jgi:glycosyltransferase involved in cell wall biosynthesis